MSRIGFILLTHNKPHQMLRLVERLNSMFGHPPIVCHHDFGKCPLPDGFLPGNVEFVQPYLNTGWAEFSVVKATAIAFKQMYRRPDSPDWCMVISGACYPTKPAAQILANLDAGGYDVHMDSLDLNPDALTTGLHEYYHSRYCVIDRTFRSVDKFLRPRMRRFKPSPFWERLLLPYHRRQRPFAGSQWFTVNRRAAEYIIRFQWTLNAVRLRKHLRSMLFSEETYFQTTLCNAPALKVHLNNGVYLDWSEKQYHPKQLVMEDLNAIKESHTHFARKFDPDASADLLDALDRIIDGSAKANSGSLTAILNSTAA